MSIQVPTNLFANSIEEKKVYYFSSNRLDTEVPHYFICIKRTANDILIMSVCTSQRKTVQGYIERTNLPYETMVWIPPNSDDSPFTEDTYINCNSPFNNFTVDELRTKYEANEVEYKGEISEVYYEQILIGLHASPVVDEDTKELIPKPY